MFIGLFLRARTSIQRLLGPCTKESIVLGRPNPVGASVSQGGGHPRRHRCLQENGRHSRA